MISGPRARHLLALSTLLACLAGETLAATMAAPEVHRRGEDQTYLTYPEWFLVHSPAELARFVADRPPSEFPWFGHIGQFWQAYGRMNDAMAGAYPFNAGYHVMVLVIGTSTTVEYALRAGYERVIGRFLEGDGPDDMTAEEHFAAFVAQDYVDFILERPWYEYDFGARLAQLWKDVPWHGERLARKWERRFALTTEFAVKAIYAQLIGFGTRTGYERPIPVTAVLLDHLPAELAARGDVEVLAQNGSGSALVLLPRYAAFTATARALAAGDVDFVEIAGNRGVIVLSLLIDDGWEAPSVVHDVLLEQPILTEPGRWRQVVRTQVGDLAAMLRAVEGRADIEHIYDY